jgi:hypothetical protein
MTMIKKGDSIQTNYGTGAYRVLSISGPYTDPPHVESLNKGKHARPSEPHYSFTVVPVSIPVGREKPSQHCYLNGYKPSLKPNIWRNVWASWDYFKVIGVAEGVQTEMFA